MRYFYALFIMILIVSPLRGMKPENFDFEKWKQEIEDLWNKVPEGEARQVLKNQVKKIDAGLSKLTNIKDNVTKVTKKAGKIISKIGKYTGLSAPGVPAEIAAEIGCEALFVPIAAAVKKGNYKLARQMSFVLAEKIGVDMAEYNNLNFGHPGVDYYDKL